MTSVKEWIEEKIRNEYIRYFEYDKFSQVNEIDRGAFGKVNKANLTDTGLVALKILFSENSKEEFNEANNEFVTELKLLREVDYHSNINRILGITKDSGYYMLVLEYANEGNLRDYLEKNSALEWNYKIQMALDIASGLKFLHSKEIIHRDLHSKNILVNNGKLLIADFGLSKKWTEVTTNSKDLQSPQPNPPNIDSRNNNSNVDDLYNIFIPDNIKLNSRDQLVHLDLQFPQPNPPNIVNRNNDLNVDDYNFCIPDNLNLDSRNQLAQQWFNEKYSEKEKINVAESKKLKLKGSLEIKDFTKLKSGVSGVRNILVVGATGSGKSALCNVLTGTDEFKEEYETQNIQSSDFDWNGNNYCVVDTIGIENTRQTTKEVASILSILKKGLKSMPGKTWQILLVIDGRFSREEIEIYNSVINKFRESLVTIVRSRFVDFRNEVECNNDRDIMLNNGIAIKRRKVLHVDNPPINSNCECGDENENIQIILQNKINKTTRNISRKILSNYLDELKSWNIFS
ncbi:unnamed protein product [Rhizophagus irregularis]|nr:unnamed protein product [Rhizophagus irregularis]